MKNRSDESESYEEYYQEISDGCGCTELWEYMSNRRGDGSLSL